MSPAHARSEILHTLSKVFNQTSLSHSPTLKGIPISISHCTSPDGTYKENLHNILDVLVGAIIRFLGHNTVDVVHKLNELLDLN